MNFNKIRKALFLGVACFLSTGVHAQRFQQDLGRGVVAVKRVGTSRTGDGGSGSLISWRKLAEEPEGTTYNVYYRKAGSQGDYTKLNTQPIIKTNYQTTLTDNTEYAVTAVSPEGVEGEMSAPFLYKTKEWDNVWFKFNFDDNVIKRNDYRTKFSWPMDTDGDGEYDAIVVDRLFSGAGGTEESEDMDDNMSATTHKIQAYTLDGKLLWTVDMGPNVNICAGQNDMVLAYDINCDGRCEVIIRSSDGTRFWNKASETWGKYVGGTDQPDTDGDGIVDYRVQSRRNPPFYISVIDGLTGEELTYSELKYSELKDGEDAYGRDNRADYKNFGYGAMEGHYGIAYLDGVHPALVMECEDRLTNGVHHGYVLSWEYDWSSGSPSAWHHSRTWSKNPKRPWCAEFHQIRILDSDGDGCDELWAGGYGVNPLKGRFTSTGLGHGDRFVISDIDPDRPGIEGFAIQQSALLGQCLYDARTAERIKEWYLPSVYDVGRGTAMDVDASRKGYEIYSYADDYYYDCKGEKTNYTRSGSIYEGVWWNADLQREELNSPGGSGWGTNMIITSVLSKSRLIEFSRESNWGTMGCTGTRPAFMGDIIGDWREEVVLANQNADGSTGLVGYSTAIPTNYSIYCLQQDPHYRLDCTTRGYYQHPNTSFYLGGGMPMPPLPPVFKADARYKSAGEYVSFDMKSTVTSVDGKSVLFDITSNNVAPVSLETAIYPSAIFVMNPSEHDFVFNGNGGTAGKATLIKSMLGKATFNTNLGHTGRNIISEGTLEVNGVVSGPVELRAKGTLSGNVVLEDTITFEGALNYEGCRLMPVGTEGVMTFKKDVVIPGDVFIEIDAANGKCGHLNVNGNLSFTGKNTLTVKQSELIAGRYLVAECSGVLTANTENISTRGLEGVNYDIVVEDNKLFVEVKTTREPTTNVLWTGQDNNVWDYKGNNFSHNGATSFVPGDDVVFTSDASLFNVTVNESMTPNSVTFRSGTYVLSGEGAISGNGGIVVEKDAAVTLGMKYSDYTGATIVNGGTLTVPNFYDGGQRSAIGAASAAEGNLQLNGGTLVLQKDNMGTDRIITLTDTATIRIASSSSALTLKGQIKGTGYLVKDGPGKLNFSYGGVNNFAGLILKQGVVAQGAWNTTFGKTNSPMLLLGGEVQLIDMNNSSTRPIFAYTATVPEGHSATVRGTTRGAINGTFKGAGTLTIFSTGVRSDIGADFSQFEGTLNANGGNFRLMNNVTNMKGTKLVMASGNHIGHYASNGSAQQSVTTMIGALASPSSATTAVLGHSGDTYQIGYLNIDTQFYGLLQASRIDKYGTGCLSLYTAGHTSPIYIYGGAIELANSSSTPMISGTITVANGGMLKGTGMATNVTVNKGGVLTAGLKTNLGNIKVGGNLRLNTGSMLLCKLGPTGGNDRFTVKGTITHNNDTLIIRVPEGRQLSVGDELLVFVSGFSSASGTPLVKCEATDAYYEFDLSTLNTDGKVRVATATTGITSPVFNSKSMSVYSLDGLLLIPDAPVSVAMNKLQPGTYIVKIRTNDGRAITEKIQKR